MNLSTQSPFCPTPGKSRYEHGSVTLVFLFLAPLFLLCFMLFAWRWSQLYDSKKLRRLCRVELQSGFNQAGHEIRALLALNTHVRRLRQEKILAKAALAAAVTAMQAPAIAAARARLKMIAAQERILRVRQKMHLWQGRRALERSRHRARQAILQETPMRGEAQRRIGNLRSHPSVPDLAVQVASQAVESPDLPTYELKPHFPEVQKMELRWQSHFEERKSRWKIPSLSLPESCGMTLTSELKTAPIQDKYFWRH